MTKGDKYLIIIIIIISFVSFIYINNSEFKKPKNKYISIQVNGEEVKKITFGANMVGKKIPINTEFGYNLIEIGDGKVRIIEADCPDKLDVKQGWISKLGETIVCLPNKLVIEINGSGRTDDDVDYISH